MENGSILKPLFLPLPNTRRGNLMAGCLGDSVEQDARLDGALLLLAD